MIAKTTVAQNAAAMELHRPLATVPPAAAAPLATTEALPSFGSIVEAVKGGGMSSDDVAKLLSVYRELKADQAEQAYNVAFAKFQKDCPVIPRSSTAKIKVASEKGAGFAYSYADIETIMRTIGPVLIENGLSVSFDGSTMDDKNRLVATCRCSHIGGHSRTSSFPVTTESSGGMSPQQKYGAAATYALRRAISQCLGLWTGDPDHDGAAEPPAPAELLTGPQKQKITALVAETGADWNRFLDWWGIANLGDALQDKYKEAIRFLEAKRHYQGKATHEE